MAIDIGTFLSTYLSMPSIVLRASSIIVVKILDKCVFVAPFYPYCASAIKGKLENTGN